MHSQEFASRGCTILLLMLSTIVGTISAFAQEPPALSLNAVQPYSAEFEYFLNWSCPDSVDT